MKQDGLRTVFFVLLVLANKLVLGKYIPMTHSGEMPEILKLNIGPEREELRGVWWGISRGGLAYAAFGMDEEEACRRVAAEVGASYEEMYLVPVFAIPYDDNNQARFTEEFGEIGVTRIIPMSNEPWPEDMDNMTDAQREAFDGLS